MLDVSEQTLRVLIASLGAIIAIVATVAGNILQERTNSSRTGLDARLGDLVHDQERRAAEVTYAATERHTAYVLMTLSQLPRAQAPLLIEPLNVAGVRMSQAVVALCGAAFSDDGPEAVIQYMNAEGVPHLIDAARKGIASAVAQLNEAYEKAFHRWQRAYNGLTDQRKALEGQLRSIDTEAMRIRYGTSTLQGTGVLLALFFKLESQRGCK